jgi:acyl carrier protein
VRRLAARVGLADGTDLGALCRAAEEAARAAGLTGERVLRSAGATERRGRADAGEEARRLESRLAEVWCEVLGRDRVGRDENFFDLGGNSLLLVTAQSAVNRAFGSDLSVVDLFAHPTVRDLARHLAARTGPTTGAQPAQAPDDREPAPASPGPHPAPKAAAPAPSGLDRAKEQAQRQRAARARRAARQERGRGHA